MKDYHVCENKQQQQQKRREVFSERWNVTEHTHTHIFCSRHSMWRERGKKTRTRKRTQTERTKLVWTNLLSFMRLNNNRMSLYFRSSMNISQFLCEQKMFLSFIYIFFWGWLRLFSVVCSIPFMFFPLLSHHSPFHPSTPPTSPLVPRICSLSKTTQRSGYKCMTSTIDGYSCIMQWNEIYMKSTFIQLKWVQCARECVCVCVCMWSVHTTDTGIFTNTSGHHQIHRENYLTSLTNAYTRHANMPNKFIILCLLCQNRVLAPLQEHKALNVCACFKEEVIDFQSTGLFHFLYLFPT